MHLNGLKFSGVLKEFSITSQCLVQTCKKQIFEEKRVLSAFCFELKHSDFKKKVSEYDQEIPQ